MRRWADSCYQRMSENPEGAGQPHNLPALRMMFERVGFLAMTKVEGRQSSCPLAQNK
jgi:hypothetical protein